MPDVRLEDVPESDRLYEIVNGKKVWLPLRSVYSCIVAHKLVERLHAYSEDWTRGDAYINMPYEMPIGSTTLRRPSGSYVSAERLRARGRLDPLREGNPVVPDLVVESLGKDDLADYTLGKVHQYLIAGVPLVWLIFPRLRQLYAYTAPDAAPRLFTEADTLDGGTVLPDFSAPMAELFPTVADEPTTETDEASVL